MHTPDYSISTPENVDLHLELAGIGNRILANLIDFTVAALTLSFIFITGVIIYTIIGYAGLTDQTQNLVRMSLASVGVSSCLQSHSAITSSLKESGRVRRPANA
ncbi:MAG: hypothetical protein K8F91_07860 [Candidatus Obscuribacterales bacterium]|nr:hypothetical protein [Candidatus Obscuribacterales bacterium]